MSNVLITPTLLDKLEFALNAPPSWKERAYTSFVKAIRREKTTMPSWVTWGFEFEAEVEKWSKNALKKENKVVTEGSNPFNEIATACVGGQFQTIAKLDFEIESEPALLYCKLDVLFPNKIIDIKTTTNWKGREKYLKGWQHKCYALATGIPSFEYRILEWKGVDEQVANKAYTAAFNVETDSSWEGLSREFDEACLLLFEFLRKENLFDDYYYIFSNNRKKGSFA